MRKRFISIHFLNLPIKLGKKHIAYFQNNSGTVTPSSGHATRGSSVRPESALTENEECSRDSFLSTPLLSDETNPVSNFFFFCK